MWSKRPAAVVIDSAMYLLTIGLPDMQTGGWWAMVLHPMPRPLLCSLMKDNLTYYSKILEELQPASFLIDMCIADACTRTNLATALSRGTLGHNPTFIWLTMQKWAIKVSWTAVYERTQALRVQRVLWTACLQCGIAVVSVQVEYFCIVTCVVAVALHRGVLSLLQAQAGYAVGCALNLPQCYCIQWGREWHCGGRQESGARTVLLH